MPGPQLHRAGAIALMIFLLSVAALSSNPAPADAASPSQFSAVSGSIASAYAAVNAAQARGGNTTSLVASLNTAIALFERAQAENASLPAAAATDLQNATAIAQQVQGSAPAIGAQGASARQVQEYVSVGTAAAIVIIAGALYVYGDRIYRRIWLMVYSGFEVKKLG